jgi:ABC-type multidrug transport system ATPase subunit
MKDFLRIVDGAGERQVELPRGLISIGSTPGATIAVQASEPGAQLRNLHWDARRAAWLVERTDGANVNQAINGRLLESAEQVALKHLDVLEAPGVFLQFQRALAEPLFHGTPAWEIPLNAAPVVFGGGREAGGEQNRVQLDAEDPVISRAHAVIECAGADYFLEDHSSHGTELNGVAFHRERLVFGDRFRISGYIFEFVGHAIRRIEPDVAGSIVARDLSVIRGSRTILDHVSLNVAAGEFVGVLGRSGQGKSTLLNALCGVNPATTGAVSIGGISLDDRARLLEVGIGYVPQDDIVHKELSVWDAIAYSAKLRLNLAPHQRTALVERVIDRLGLTPFRHQRVEQLSGGQRKRVSIAIELLAKPSVLFLDEPSSGLDPAMEAELMTLLQSLTLTKLTVICTTHVLHKAYLFDRILIIEGARLIFAGRSDEARLHFLLSERPEGSAGTASFETAPLERIYTLLQESGKTGRPAPAEWEQSFKASAFAPRATPPVPAAHAAVSTRTSQRLRVGALTTVRTLAARQWAILRADKLNLAFLLAQPLVIGGLIGWIGSDMAQRLFLCIVATMWFGCSNGAQQIVAELPIFRRERVCGQGLNAYVFSKLSFLSAVTLLQAVVLLFTALTAARVLDSDKTDYENVAKDFAKRLTPVAVQPAGGESTGSFNAVDSDAPGAARSTAPAAPAEPEAPRPPNPLLVRALVGVGEFFQITQNLLDTGPRPLKKSDGSITLDARGNEVMLAGLPVTEVLAIGIGLRLLALAAAAIASVSIGLAVSSLVKNTTQAVLWVPLVLIPQILFGGILVAVPEMSRSVWHFSQIMPSFAAQRVMDVAAVFGGDVPAISNRTKTPLFLSPLGEKETIEWIEKDETRSQDYDKLSKQNASWQNLLVTPDKLGAHKWEKRPVGEGGFTYPDSVEQRGDVVVRKGVSFRDFTPSNRGLAVLLAWGAVCYAVMLTGLVRRQTGR